MSTVWSFIALDLPHAVKASLEDVIHRLRPSVSGVRWVRSQNLHLTLRFLGNVDVDRLDAVAAAIRLAGSDVGAVRLALNEVGAFPRVDRARVIWVGLIGDLERLSRLQQSIEGSLEEEGFEREARPFRPHLTIGRVRSEQASLADLPGLPQTEFELDSLSLIRSDLAPGGARYTSLETVRLSSDG